MGYPFLLIGHIRMILKTCKNDLENKLLFFFIYTTKKKPANGNAGRTFKKISKRLPILRALQNKNTYKIQSDHFFLSEGGVIV
jgi:hypothetical protein